MNKIDVLSVIVLVLFGVVFIYGGFEKFLLTLVGSTITYFMGQYSERIRWNKKKEETQ